MEYDQIMAFAAKVELDPRVNDVEIFDDHGTIEAYVWLKPEYAFDDGGELLSSLPTIVDVASFDYLMENVVMR